MKSRIQQIYLLLFCTFIYSGNVSGSENSATNSNWVHLFNGVNLTGWVNINGAPETWSVKDGVIHCTGKPICALRTDKRYQNFVLELEWRHLKPGGNAGVFIWAAPEPAVGQPFLRAIEVQVLDHAYGKSDWFTTHGDVFPIHGSKMKPFPPARGMRSFPSQLHSKGSPEWNHYKIDCKNGVLKLSVNGHEVSGGDNCNWRKGYIALESEGSPVEFRNIRIKEFSNDSHLNPSQTAPLPGGFFGLYNGIDLRDWVNEKNDSFEPRDWRLISRPEVNSNRPEILWSRGLIQSNFEIFIDIKPPKEFDAEKHSAGDIYLFGQQSPILSLGNGVADMKLSHGYLTPNKWNRIYLKCYEDTLEISGNGKSLKIPINKPENFLSTTQNHFFGISASRSHTIEWANIFARSLVPEKKIKK